MNKWLSVLAGAFLLMGLMSHQAEAKAWGLNATVTASPAPQIVLRWNTASSTSWTLHRRVAGTSSWGSAITGPFTLSGNYQTYADTSVSVGVIYEYALALSSGVDQAFIYAGIEAPLIENRGKLLLLVDNRFSASLAPELTRLMQDMAGDGWEVIREDASIALSVPEVRAKIKSYYTTNSIKAVLLFGHFAVPYSGKIVPDGHQNEHWGAWPADVYYADMNGVWTDTLTLTFVVKLNNVDTLCPLMFKHRNVPGDGKFDQNTVSATGDATVELELGRIDLGDMPAFGVSETELLRRYLNKNHAYRQRQFNASRKAVRYDCGWDDAQSADRSYPTFFVNGETDTTNVAPAVYGFVYGQPSPAPGQPYLWVYGNGGGGPQHSVDVGNTTDFANNNVQGVFTMIWGSFNGVWDDVNAFQRAPLASPGSPLTCCMGLRSWTFHEMALGYNIGLSIRKSQSGETPVPFSWDNQIEMTLQGDPTLRMYMVAPATQVTAIDNGSGGVTVSWGASSDTVTGYQVYRGSSSTGSFTRLTSGGGVTGTTYTDSAPLASSVYMVRAVKLETTGSGTFYNPSQGATVSYPAPAKQVSVTTTGGLSQTSPATVSAPHGTYQTLTVPAETDPNPVPGISSAYVCSWAGTGSVPSGGKGRSVSLLLDQDSTITWSWTANSPSSVAFSSPLQGGTYVASSVRLEASASDADGLIDRVEFYEGNQLLGTDTVSSWDWVWDGSATHLIRFFVDGLTGDYATLYKQSPVASYRFTWAGAPLGSHTVAAKVYDVYGGVTTSFVDFTVAASASPLAITSQPQNVTVPVGQRPSFSVGATGALPFTYVWKWNGAVISFEEGSSYVGLNATAKHHYLSNPDSANGVNVLVVVTDALNNSVTSDVATLAVTVAPPTVTAQPLNQSVLDNQTATFSVGISAQVPPQSLLYQWQKQVPAGGWTAISQATNAAYAAVASVGDNGNLYRVTVSHKTDYIGDGYLPGSVTSAPALLTVTANPLPPTIDTQPTNQMVSVGQAASFSVSASGTAPLYYQWRTNGVDIGTATNASHVTAATVLSDSGKVYSVAISNSLGVVTSLNATLSVVLMAPTISVQPANQAVTAGQTASFSVTASGTAPLYYQWRTNGISLSGATASSYTTPATATNDSGTLYSVVVSNAAGSVTSSNALLTVTVSLVAPAITSQPTNQTVTAGQTASFSVTASGTAPLYYQWRTNGASLAGAAATAYTTPATATNDSGTLYSVVVSNTAGSVTSVTAVLTVNAPPVQPAALPFSDSFEAYAPGFNVGGTNGWTAEADGAVVTTLAYKPRMPPGYPLPAAAHSRVLQVNSAAQNALPGVSNQNVNVDFMLQPTNGVLVESLGTTVQLGLAVDTQGVVQVWHASYDGGSWTQNWTALGTPPVGTSGWVRISIALDYSSNAEGHTLFRPFMNGMAYPTAAGVVSPTDLTPSGSWYVCANSPAANGGGQKKISGFKVESDNPSRLDDFIVTLDPFAYRDPPFSALLIVK